MDFKSPYKRQAYLDFFQNQLLPDDFERADEKITIDFKPDRIRSAVKIADVPSLDLSVYEIEHQSENDPRVSLSRETFRLLANYGKQRALVLFTSKSSKNFRLSLVTIDLKWEEGKRPTKEYSNPKRFSFFLGPDAKVHTVQEYLIAKDKRVKDFEDLKSRFSIEVVNKDFYNRIAALFTNLAGGQRGSGKKTIDAGEGLLKLPQTTDDTVKKNFAVRLIGRLIFCWFLKKKKPDKGQPLLPEELLSNQVIDNKGIGGFYHSVLEPLFFEVLNTPVSSRNNKFKKEPWSTIPFLNGGLFTPHEDDFYELANTGFSKHLNTLQVPDGWLKELFGVFETYNFTIDENTAVDVELSIEPEMLGRIFENLLAEINPETGETARKSTGSYYTPRPIVEYMVDESLKQYLLTKTNLPEEKIVPLLSYSDEDTKLNEAQKDSILDALDAIKIIDPACGSGAFPMGILQKILLILQKIDPQSKKWLQKILARIENTTARKEIEKKLKEENWNYVHKLGIIQNSIYGVDIQPIAVEISKLRCLLSLIVDQNIDDARTNRGIEPLPNLDFRFVCGNSLIDTIFGFNTRLSILENHKEVKKLIKNIEQDKSNYFSLSTEEEKVKLQLKLLRQKLELAEYLICDRANAKSYTDTFLTEDTLPKKEAEAKAKDEAARKDLELLRKQVADVQSALEKKKIKTYQDIDKIKDDYFSKFFAWRIDFAEVFAERGGFDIVIANPPYVRQESIKELKPTLKAEGYECFDGVADLLVYFYERGIKLLRGGGTISLITSNKFYRAGYGEKLRGFLARELTLHRLIDFGDAPVFEAIAYASILMGVRTTPSLDASVFAYTWEKEMTFERITQTVLERGQQICQSELKPEGWQLESPAVFRLLEKLRRVGKPLGEYVKGRFYYGIKTGLGEAFVVDLITRNRLIREHKSSAEILKPFLRGRDVKRWGTEFAEQYLIKIESSENKDHPWSGKLEKEAEKVFAKTYPAIHNHFQSLRDIKLDVPDARGCLNMLEKVQRRDDQGKYFWELRSCIYWQEFEQPKIILGRFMNRATFAFDTDRYYHNDALYMIAGANEFAVAILNSSTSWWFLTQICTDLQNGYLQAFRENLFQIPIPAVPTKQQKPVERLVEQILAAKQRSAEADVSALEREIDQMVYKLYDLTPEEIAIVEGK